MRIAYGLLIVAAVLSSAAGASAQCPGEFELIGGIADNFAPPQEDAVPDSALAAFIANVLVHPEREFDETGLDQTFGHTFTEIGTDLCGATLTIHLRALEGNPQNDTVNLEFIEDYIPGVTSAWGWGLFIGTIIGSSWDTGDEATIILDLADLPPDPGGRTSVIDAFADGDFDVVVDEDTQVDFVTITLCGCETATETSSWGRVKARFTGEGD